MFWRPDSTTKWTGLSPGSGTLESFSVDALVTLFHLIYAFLPLQPLHQVLHCSKSEFHCNQLVQEDTLRLLVDFLWAFPDHPDLLS